MLFLVAGLAAIVMFVRIGAERHAATSYLASALLFGGVATWLFDAGGDGPWTRAALYIIDPLVIWGVVQAIRLALGGEHSPPWMLRLLFAAIAASLGLLLLGASIRVEYLPAITAQVIVYLDGIRFLCRAKPGRIRTGLLVSMGVMTLTALVRLPFFPTLLDAGRAYPLFDADWLQGFLLVTTSFAVPAVTGFIIAAVIQRQLGIYRHQSQHDELTGLLTRRAFSDNVRDHQPGFGAIVLTDIDFFKAVNDRHGHGVGDDVIRLFAELLNAAAPVAGRFGGEEFAIALPGYSLARAAEVAESLRAAFAAVRHSSFAPDQRLSASFGVAPYFRRRPLDTSYAEADRALYRAKNMGRNAVCIFGTNEFERGAAQKTA